MDNEKSLYKSLIEKFNKAKVAVIGDIVADVYVYGRQFKLSREAPVIVAKYENEEILPGGAGNIINNIVSLGATVYPIGLIGKDNNGKSLLDYFSNHDVDTKGLLTCNDRTTITKTRFLVGDSHTTKRQVVRFDKEPNVTMDGNVEQKIIDYIDTIEDKIDLLITSDYGYDIITASIIKRIKILAKDKLVVADSRHRVKEFKGVTIITPNESEAEEATNKTINNKNHLLEVGRQLLNEVNTKAVLITQGNQGMTLFEDDGRIEQIPVYGKREVIDVTGAGDTVASLLSLSMASGASFIQAAKLSNFGASVTVMKNGPATINKLELIQAIDNNP
ncbi:MAG: bifunctional heptose 7-phosphate kinase/heptose 1-phosphate adenyltransferase [Candidatus Scalinduaceae bacterium]